MKNAVHRRLALALLIAAAPAGIQPAAAQTEVPQAVPATLDLETAIGYALTHNFAIQQARERIRQQDGVVVEVSSRRLPGLAAGAAYQLNEREISAGYPASDRGWQVSLTASQLLYSGGGTEAAVRGAKLAREAAALELRAVINEALLQVRTAFYTVLLTREQIKVQESNLDLLQQQLKTVTDRFEAGTVSSFEKLRAEVAVANAKAPLITARNDHRLAIEALRLALGFDTRTPESIGKVPEFVGSLEFTPRQFELQAAFGEARTNRPDLQRLERLTEARDAGVTSAQAGFRPNVAAFGGWALRKGPSDRLSDSNSGWLAGVQAQWNIFDGRATQGRVAQARSALAQAKLTVTEASLAVDVEVRRAHSKWQQAAELAEASAKVVEQATEAARLANARYSAGTGTQLDVLAAQVDLTTARTNQLQAFYGYNVAVAALRKAMGQPDEAVKM